jgi:hypothetical protein
MLVLWALAVLLGITMTSAPSAQPRLYLELAHRYKNVRDRLAQLTAGSSAQPSVEARNSLLYSNRVLIGEENGPALRWALAYGYVSVLRALHRAEQEIMIFEPREDLLGDIPGRKACRGSARPGTGPWRPRPGSGRRRCAAPSTSSATIAATASSAAATNC